MKKDIEQILKEIATSLKQIKKIVIDNNQISGFIASQQTPRSPHLNKEDIKSIMITSEQLDYMAKEKISMNVWGDA